LILESENFEFPLSVTIRKRGALCSVVLIKHYSDDKIKKNTIDRACSMYEGHTGVWWGNHREETIGEDPGLDERILKWIFKWNGGMV
jgi:hypothetical protein